MNTISRPVMNPPADQAEAGNRANTAPRQSDSHDARRGSTELSCESEARPVTLTAQHSTVVHDLFGEVPPSPPKVSTAGQAHGYAALPGTGPKGETCGSCAHLYHKYMAKTYLKCALMQAKWTGGHGTDVLSRSPACSRWKSK